MSSARVINCFFLATIGMLCHVRMQDVFARCFIPCYVLFDTQVHWAKWQNSLAAQTTWYNAAGLFPLGIVKSIVYRGKLSNIDDLKIRVTTAIAAVDADPSLA